MQRVRSGDSNSEQGCEGQANSKCLHGQVLCNGGESAAVGAPVEARTARLSAFEHGKSRVRPSALQTAKLCDRMTAVRVTRDKFQPIASHGLE